MKANRWYLVAIGILLLLWLRAEWRAWELNSEIGRVYRKEVIISAVDGQDMKPLHIVFRGPPMTMGQRWPKEFRMSGTGNESEIRVEWIDIGPVDVGVAAEGYPEQRLLLGPSSEDRIVVQLRR